MTKQMSCGQPGKESVPERESRSSLRWEGAWHVKGTGRESVWLKQSKQGETSRG